LLNRRDFITGAAAARQATLQRLLAAVQSDARDARPLALVGRGCSSILRPLHFATFYLVSHPRPVRGRSRPIAASSTLARSRAEQRMFTAGPRTSR
jgi:hypothetical protein